MKRLCEYERHADGKRFHVRTYDRGKWQVYGVGLDHICDCQNEEIANRIAYVLEQRALCEQIMNESYKQDFGSL